MTAKVQVNSLTVQFTDTTTGQPIKAVQNLSLSLNAGEFVCVVGPSGCGKSTLLRVLAGLERPTSGTVHITSDDKRRPDYAMVFQDAGLFPWMSVLENINYGMRMQRMPGPKRYKTAQGWIDRVGLSRFVDTFPAQLSGGMKQRVGLARAFAHNPEVLLMDEPFGALDAQTRLILQETLLNLWKSSDMTILFVTHSIEEALTLADRILIMSARPGHIIAEYPVEFPRPREVMALRTQPEFGQQYANIWEILREQVNQELG